MRNIFIYMVIVLSIILNLQTVRAEDYKFFNINFMAGMDAKNPYNNKNDQYIELEFGGTSGIMELYGYVDILDAYHNKNSDNNGASNLFLEIKPRFKIYEFDAGFLKNLYISTASLVDGGNDLFHESIGLGTNIFGLGFNVYTVYKFEDFGSSAEKSFDGIRLDLSWFKPLYHFSEKNFIAYQGYFNYIFSANNIAKDINRTEDELQTFQGLYFHFQDKFAIGYGLKVFKNMGYYKNNTTYNVATDTLSFKSTGIGHYVALTYKF